MRDYLLTCLLISCNVKGKCSKVVDSDKFLEKVAKKQEIVGSPIKRDSMTVDSLQKGIKFYNYHAFKNYQFIETEPYEFIATTSKMKSAELILYHKDNYNYIVLVVGDRLVDEVDYDWEKLEKEITDIVRYPKDLALCWYPMRKIKENIFDTKGFGIGKIYKEDNNRTVYSKEKLFVADYDKGIIEEIKDNNPTFECNN